MDLNTKLHQSKKIHWNWKNKGYPNTIDKENTRGQGPKTKKKQKKKRAYALECSLRICPFEAWKKKSYTDYMAVKYTLGHKPLNFKQWYEKTKKDNNRLISNAINTHWKEQQNFPIN